ncbi:hypothetical protein [Phenylobacterium sp.]|uniref:hypothetical protein n=1 Tax=Phenylobacterium sp. TaxID=1871053 RepID=UPI002728C66D|nr:hypothetical protein [Phenylobacterium sp.]MDO8801849.1 hypothetical protein [Phenylobacterium sp.]
MRRLVILVCLALTAGAPPPAQRSFVACPMIRDTEPVPCWLAESGGELYYLGVQGDISEAFHPPQLRHRALVEGTVLDGSRVCGGVVLKPVVVSALPEIDETCAKVLPAEGFKIADFPRGPGPANRGRQLATGPEVPRPLPPAPQPPYGVRTWDVRFGFEGLYINVHQFRGVLDAVAYAKASGGQVRVEGWRAASRLSNGETLAEPVGIAQARTDKVVQALTELGAAPVAAVAHPDLETPDGVTDPERRRVRITVRP